MTDGEFSVRRTKEEQEKIDEKVLCFVPENSWSRDAAQLDHHEVVIVFWGSTKTETRAESKTASAVLDAEEQPATPDPLSLE